MILQHASRFGRGGWQRIRIAGHGIWGMGIQPDFGENSSSCTVPRMQAICCNYGLLENCCNWYGVANSRKKGVDIDVLNSALRCSGDANDIPGNWQHMTSTRVQPCIVTKWHETASKRLSQGGLSRGSRLLWLQNCGCAALKRLQAQRPCLDAWHVWFHPCSAGVLVASAAGDVRAIELREAEGC